MLQYSPSVYRETRTQIEFGEKQSMTTYPAQRLFVAVCLAGLGGWGCEKSEPADRPSTAPPKAASSPPIIPPVSSVSRLSLTGLTMEVPRGWKFEPVSAGPMSPRAVFRLPKAENDEKDGMVRVTYFPGMKGKDELNINRWLNQVTKPDGSSISRDEANISVTEKNLVRLTVVDMVGTVKVTMRASARPNSRMIAAILDHPQGPHFVVAAGGVNTMKKWESDLHKFLQSAAVK